jgi:hypothetical protein
MASRENRVLPDDPDTMPRPFRAAAALTILLLAAGRARAQGEDALVLPRGVVEGNASASFVHFTDLFGSGGRLPLGTAFETPLDASTFTATASTRDSLQRFFDATRTTTGSGAFTVTANDVRLGTFTPNLSAEQRIAPLSLRAGLTNWLTVGVTVPIEWRRTEVSASRFVDPGIGPNPNATRNRQLLAAIDPTLAGVGSSAYLPVKGTPAAVELERRYELLRAKNDTSTLELPVRGINEDELQKILPNGGVYPFFGEQRAYRPGDVELSARVQLLNTTGARFRPAHDAASGIRVAVEGAFRFPTGKGADLDSLLEVPAPSGHGGASGALFADVFRGRLWVSAAGRYTHPLARDVLRRTWTVGSPFLPLSDSFTVRRTPGSRMEIAVTPRYRLTDEISLAARYEMMHQGATTLSPSPDPGLAFAGIESTAAQTVHLAGGGLSYSTLTSYGQGRADVPYEFSILLESAVSGSGNTPAVSVVTLTGRVFVRAWGVPRRPRPDTTARDTAAAHRPPQGPPADVRPRQPATRPDTVARPPATIPPATLGAQPSTAPSTAQPPRTSAPATGRVVPKQALPPTTTGSNPPPSGTTPPTSSTAPGTPTTPPPGPTTSPPPVE